MKYTKLMLAFISTFITTWLTISTIGWLCGTFVTFKFVATHQAVMAFMMLFGWIPAIIVVNDINEKFNEV